MSKPYSYANAYSHHSETTSEQIDFYREVLGILNNGTIPYLIGGGYAFREHSGVVRETGDLDVFCKTSDYPRLLKLFEEHGFTSVIQDARWIAKSEKGDYHLDFIFNSVNGLCPVDDFWFEHGTDGQLYGVQMKFVGAEELIWCKAYMCDRYRYDGADINHIILHRGHELDWKWILTRMEQHWQLLFAHILNFSFVYPSERKQIPRWLVDELMDRFKNQMEIPTPKDKVCRGPLISQTQYETDIKEWNYKVLTYQTL